MLTMAIILELFAVFACLLMLKKVRSIELYSPVYIFLFYYLVIFIVGWIISPIDYEKGGVSAFLELSKYEYDYALHTGLVICLSFSVGALVNLSLTRNKVERKIFINTLFSRFNGLRDGGVSNNVVAVVFLMCVVTLLMVLLGVGISNIFYREMYLPVEIRSLKILGVALTPITIIASGYLFFKSRLLVKVIMFVFLGVFLIVYFSLASRWFALIPTLFVLGGLLANPMSTKIKALTLLTIVFSFCLLVIPLSLRSLEIQGLAPFFLEITNNLVIIDLGLFETLLNNLFFSFPLTGHVVSTELILFDSIKTSFNPLPGEWTDWYLLSEKLKVNQYTPFNSPGELVGYSIFIAILFYFLLGFYFARIDRKITVLMLNKRVFLSFLFIGLTTLYSISSLQYNLRSGVRLLYYIIFVESAVYLISYSMKNIKSCLINVKPK